jgi:hypothetical protein
VTLSLVSSTVMATNREGQGHTVSRQCVTQRQIEGSRRYLAVPTSSLPIKPSFVMQPSHAMWSGKLAGHGDEAIRGGT